MITSVFLPPENKNKLFKNASTSENAALQATEIVLTTVYNMILGAI